MLAEITEQILEMLHQKSLLGQKYSVKNVSITAKHAVFECEKKELIYCCPHCKQHTFSCYDSMRRSYQNVAKVLKKIKRKARLKIKWVSVDFLPAIREQAGWKPYLKIIHQYFPNAQIVLDKFHLTCPPSLPTGSRRVGQLNKAIYAIRKDEQMTQEGEGRRILKNSRWLFLYGQENLNESQSQRLNTITNLNQNLYQAYLLKEEFRSIMNELRESEGRTVIIQWIETVMATNLEPLKKFVRLIKRHLQKLLNYFVHPIASGLAEGLNNLIATVKKKAYGYRNMKYFKFIESIANLLKILQQNQKQLLLTHTNL